MNMDKVMNISGNFTAIVGVLICLIAGMARLAGQYHLGGFETVSLFIGGTSIMVMACLLKLQQISLR